MEWKLTRGRKVAATIVGVAALGAALTASVAVGKSSAAPIKVAILSDCKGAFGAFYEQDIGGAQAAFANYAGGKAKDKKKPSKGMTGIKAGGREIKIVGYGCSDDKAETALKETRRLMEGLKADILIGPLSGDEGIAVANYAKKHPKQTFLNGTSGAQDTTLKVRAKNFFRFNSDGAQWSAGLGDYAYSKLGWRKAAIIMDNYSFAWTSAGGMIAEFCAVGGDMTTRLYPELGTTDYSTFARQLPKIGKGANDVDGYFVAVGGTGTTAFLKAYEQAVGPIDGTKFIGNLFFSDPTQYAELSDRIAGALASGPTAGDSKSATAAAYANNVAKVYPGLKANAPSVFLYNYYNAAWGLIKGLTATKGDISGAKLWPALSKATLKAGYGNIKLDANRNAITDNYVQQLYKGSDGKLAVKTILRIPAVDQTFGGTFSPSTPAPGQGQPTCTKRSLPWIGKAQPVN